MTASMDDVTNLPSLRRGPALRRGVLRAAGAAAGGEANPKRVHARQRHVRRRQAPRRSRVPHDVVGEGCTSWIVCLACQACMADLSGLYLG